VEAVAQMLRLDFGRKAPAVAHDANVLKVRPTDPVTGWQYAHWLVAQSPALGITEVTFADRRWSAKTDKWSGIAAPAAEVTAEVSTG
jgi:hypothetical protein